MRMKLVSFVILCAFLLVPTIVSAEAAGGNAGYALTTGRLWATTDAVVGLISAVIGGLSLARSAGRIGKGTGRRGAIVAMVLALIVIVYAVVHMAIFTGDFGTGSGRAGAIVAIVTGLTGAVLGGLTLIRSRRTG
ncbi:DUF6223 family protein [Paenibacillus montanisoli]|uniref:TIGR04086 family membrane protein n=1 Tax=Paenibacillus montanisoli TaxID=2081970 RepID=A0A328U6U0_9BACL|nr:DUF6223 family protein [Paenibacillus montanisoli]RAP78568.1 hypothetical protein DL346_09150 [Paenibacillus montanisoli]